MSAITKFLTRKTFAACSVAQQAISVCGVRSIFSATFFDSELYDKYKATVQRESGKNKETLRANLAKSLEKPETNVFTEDLQKWLYLSESDEDVELLVNGILKYQKQDPDIYGFHFETPLLKFFYFNNKIDKALELHAKNLGVSKTLRCNLMILNKLVAEKRYTEALAFGEEALKITATEGKLIDSFHNNVTLLIAECLHQQNTKNSLEKMKQLIEKKPDLPNRLLKTAFLLAIDQNEVQFAYDLLKKMRGENSIKVNLEIIALSKLNRLEEAVDRFQQNVASEKPFYKFAIDSLQEAIKNNPSLKEKVDDQAPNMRLTRLDLLDSVRTEITPPTTDARPNNDLRPSTFRDMIRKPFGERRSNENFQNRQKSGDNFQDRQRTGGQTSFDRNRSFKQREN